MSGSKRSIDVYDFFDADPVSLKKFKEETLADFIEALELEETEQLDEAQRAFERLRSRALMAGVKDLAIERHVHNVSGPSTPVATSVGSQRVGGPMRFDKHGDALDEGAMLLPQSGTPPPSAQPASAQHGHAAPLPFAVPEPQPYARSSSVLDAASLKMRGEGDEAPTCPTALAGLTARR